MTIAIIDIETTGLNPMQDRIITIGVGVMHKDEEHGINGVVFGKMIIHDMDEKEMLEEFWSWIKVNNVEKIIGFNIDFDWDFLKLRSLYHRVKLKHFRKYQGRIDLREILNGNRNRYKKGTGLKDYIKFFGFDIDEDDKDGSEVPELWSRYEEGDEGALEEIKKHLSYDLDRTWELYNICLMCGLIEE
jgi:uncharacterized protein YprB with RNaseH-like and TPR domain